MPDVDCDALAVMVREQQAWEEATREAIRIMGGSPGEIWQLQGQLLNRARMASTAFRGVDALMKEIAR